MEFPRGLTSSDQLPNRPYCFTLPTCAAVALNFSSVTCPRHPDRVVPLKELIPDLLLSDLPRHMLIVKSEFQFQINDSSRLGSGGAGEVFLGTYKKEPVAVKTFHSTRNARLVRHETEAQGLIKE